MKTLTVVAPAFNEEAVIAQFHKAVRAELDRLEGYESDILIVVDGGSDRTFEILSNLGANDPKLRSLKFSRNFGHQMAFLAGVDHTDSDVVIMMDCDLQHPPALIPSLVKAYEEGADIVYTIRTLNPNLGFMRRLQSRIFYRLLNTLSEVPIAENSSDFRLISRRVARVLREGIHERGLFLRGIVHWIGFRQRAIEYEAHERFAGSSKFNTLKLIKFGLTGAIAFSRKPLRAATVAGILFALFGIVVGIVTIIQYYLGMFQQPGFASIVVLLSLFGGIQLFFMGVIGEYVGAVFDEIKMRPHYVIESRVNVEGGSDFR